MIIDKAPYFPKDSRYPEYEKGLISLVKGIFFTIFLQTNILGMLRKDQQLRMTP